MRIKLSSIALTICIIYIFSFLSPFSQINEAIQIEKNNEHNYNVFLNDVGMRSAEQKISGIYNLSNDMNTTIKGINGEIVTYSLATGDIDNDGREDILVGDFSSNYTGREMSGIVFLIFGSDRNTINSKADLSIADVIINGAAEGDTIARNICSGDIDNDGYNDILIPSDNINKLYIIYGKPKNEFPNIIDLNESTSYPHADVTIIYNEEHEQFSISVGDINGDGYDDIVMGSASWNYNTGRVYVIYGGDRVDFGKKKYLPDDADINIIGPEDGYHTGYYVFTSDVTNDNKSEIFIGYAFDHSGILGIYGSDNLPSTILFNETERNFNADFLFKFDKFDYASFRFASGDLNGDKYKDLIFSDGPDSIMVVEEGVTHGKVYVIYGGDKLPKRVNLSYSNNSPHADLLIKGNEDRDCFGRGLAVGDIDRNGKADIISGASQAYGIDNLKKWSGETYLIYGRIKEKFSKINYISQIEDATFFGINNSDFSGDTVASGDIDGDGTDDIIIASAFWTGVQPQYRDIYIKYGIPTSYDIEMGLEDDLHIIGRGETTEYQISVSNSCQYNDVIDFLVANVPEKWNAELNYNSLAFGSGELNSIILTVTAPNDVRHTDWANITVYGISRSDDTVSDMVIARTQMVINKGVEIETKDNESGIRPLSTKTFNVNITNRGSFEDEFHISISDLPVGWKVKARPQYVYLLPFVDSTFNITVTHNNLSSSEDIGFIVTAVSEYDYRINSTQRFTVFTNLSFKFSMEIVNSNIHKVKPGGSTNFTFKLKNLCEFTFDINLSINPQKSLWELSLSEDSINFKRYEFRTLNLSVRAPRNSIDGDQLTTIITASIYTKPYLQFTNYTKTIVSIENKLVVASSNLNCYGYPDHYTSVNLSVTNTGTSDYISNKLIELPVNWLIDISPSIIFLNTNESIEINVRILIGQEAINKNYKIAFNLISGTFSQMINIIVNVNQTFDIIVENTNNKISIIPGRNITIPFSVKNNGNGQDLIVITPANLFAEWIQLDNTEFTLAYGEFKNNIALITVPPETLPGLYDIELIINSSGNPRVIKVMKIECTVLKPDLSLSLHPINESLQLRSEYAFRITVHNRGNISISEEIKIYLLVDEKLVTENTIIGIPANGDKLIVMRWNIKSGSHLIKFSVDPNDIIPESNEYNNEISYETGFIGNNQNSNSKTNLALSISILLVMIIVGVLILFLFYRRAMNRFNEKYRCSIIKPFSGSDVNIPIETEGTVSDKSITNIYLQLDESDWFKVPVKDKKWTYKWEIDNLDEGIHHISAKIKKFRKETIPVKVPISILKNNKNQ